MAQIGSNNHIWRHRVCYVNEKIDGFICVLWGYGGKILSLLFLHLYTCYRPIFSCFGRFRFYGHLKVGCWREKWTKNRAEIQCFDHNFVKMTFKLLLFLRCLILSLEKLRKGTSQRCKKFDESGFLTFSFLPYL